MNVLTAPRRALPLAACLACALAARAAAAAPDCYQYILYSISNYVPYTAGSLDAVLAGNPSGCEHPWTATSNDPSWLSVTPTSGNAPTTLHVSYAGNTGAPRTGTVTVVGQYFAPPMVLTVNQAEGTGMPLCNPDANSLCLLNGRFRVTAAYSDYGGHTGTGKAVSLTSDTGYFWFFNSANVEGVIKMVPFCGAGSSNAVAVYATGLTDLGVTFTVTDTRTGTSKTYTNALGTPFKLIRDGPFACPAAPGSDPAAVSAFVPLTFPEAPRAEAPPAPELGYVTPLAPCAANATTLCLVSNRFRVTASYKDYGGHTGTGQAVSLTSDTGYFWFFTAANVESVVKLVSFCGGGTNRWGVYANGLTDVQVTLAVTDTQTGLTATYTNALGHPFELIRDAAFNCP